MALVNLATRSIETKLFIEQFKSELILNFHPRQEYLSTTSVGLLAINGDGIIVGSNSNAKIMLHGLMDIKNQDFNNIFTETFSSIASNILNNKIIKVTDYLGSSVFIVKNQNYNGENKKQIIENIKTYACENCKDAKMKREKCILIKSTFLQTQSISQTARRLGISRTTVYKHLN